MMRARRSGEGIFVSRCAGGRRPVNVWICTTPVFCDHGHWHNGDFTIGCGPERENIIFTSDLAKMKRGPMK